MPISSIHHVKQDGSSLFTILSLHVLKSLDFEKIKALQALGIFTLGDLLRYDPIHKSRVLISFMEGHIAHDIELSLFLDASYISTPSSDIGNLPTAALTGVGTAYEKILLDKFKIGTIKELSEFPPFVEAEAYLLPDKEVFNEPPSAPEDLLPKIIGSTHSVARFSSFIKGPSILMNDVRVEFINTGKNFPHQRIIEIFENNVFRCHLGYIAGFKQYWLNMGTHLGEIIHNLALAPGESRTMAIVEWYRRRSSNRSEDTIVDEALTNNLVHSRALNEVVKSTAKEFLSGSTNVDVTTKTAGAGVTAGQGQAQSAGGSGSGGNGMFNLAGAGLGTMANSMGMSAVYSKGTQKGTIQSTSSGVRELSGEVQQNITDSTVQNASNVRSLYSTIVVTDVQSEKEEINTRSITNYNHSHALTIQYYEVLHKYNIMIDADNYEPILYLPFRPISFSIDIVHKYWYLFRFPVREVFPIQFERFDTVVKGYEPSDENFNINDKVVVNKIRLSVNYKGGTFVVLKSTSMDHVDPNFKVYIRLDDGTPIVWQTGPGYKENALNDVDLAKIKKVTIVVDHPPISIAATGFTKFTISIVFSLKDSSGYTFTQTKTYESEYPLSLFDGINEKVELTNDLQGEIIDLINNSGNVTSLEVIGQLQEHFEINKYAYTRYLLDNLEDEQVSDIVENLYLHFPSGVRPLSDFVDASPIAISGNLLIFRLRPRPNPCRIVRFVTGCLHGLPVLPIEGVDGVDFKGKEYVHYDELNIISRYKLEGDIERGMRGATDEKIWLDFEVVDGQMGVENLDIKGNVTVQLIIGNVAAMKSERRDFSFAGKLKQLDGGNHEIIIDPASLAPQSHGFGFSMIVIRDYNLTYENFALDYVTMLEREFKLLRGERKSRIQDSVYLPTPGVFAEAILGRSNASEYIDPRRFWNWQDSPIPHIAPQIAPIVMGQHTVTDPASELTPNVPTSNLNIINPPQYPMPTSLLAAMQAIQNGNMFRDMSKTDQFVTILGSLADLANNTAQLVGNLSGEAAKSTLNGAIELGKQVAGMVNTAMGQTGKASPPSTMTEKGAALNTLNGLSNQSNLDNAKANIVGADITPTKELPEAKQPESILSNPNIADKISKGDTLEYSNGSEKIKIDKIQANSSGISSNNIATASEYVNISPYLRPDEKVSRVFINGIDLNDLVNQAILNKYGIGTNDIKSILMIGSDNLKEWILEESDKKGVEYHGSSSSFGEFSEDVDTSDGKTIEYSKVTMMLFAKRHSMERMMKTLVSSIIQDISTEVEAKASLPSFSVTIPIAKLISVGLEIDNDTSVAGGVNVEIKDIRKESYVIVYKVEGKVAIEFTPYFEPDNKPGTTVKVEQKIEFEIEKTVKRASN